MSFIPPRGEAAVEPIFEQSTVLDASRQFERYIAKIVEGRVQGVLVTQGDKASAVIVSAEKWHEACRALEQQAPVRTTT
jgi:PHD/YefM family antitoxin component YafN of YafNO toxin-antitoxin module